MDSPEVARPNLALRLHPKRSQAGHLVRHKLGRSHETLAESDSEVCPSRHRSRVRHLVSRKEGERVDALACHAKVPCNGTVMAAARAGNQRIAVAGRRDPNGK